MGGKAAIRESDPPEPHMAQDEKQVETAGQIAGKEPLVHLCWMVLGIVALAICPALIEGHTEGSFSAASSVSWGRLSALVWLHSADVTRALCNTAGGKPAKLSCRRRFPGSLLLYSLP
ncbi:MAG: hypothetical protein ACE15C_17190 [Phycisphaerae bacterium]